MVGSSSERRDTYLAPHRPARTRFRPGAGSSPSPRGRGEAVRLDRRARWSRSGCPTWGVLLPPRRERRRKDHCPSGHLGAGDAGRRAGRVRRGRDRGRSLARSRHRDGVPDVRSLSAPFGLRESRLPAPGSPDPRHRDPGAGGRNGGDAAHRPCPGTQAGDRERRRAAAGGDRPGPHSAPSAAAPRRAPDQSRRQSPPRNARRVQAAAPRARNHDAVRDARRARGARHGRTHRGAARRPHRPDRLRGRAVRTPVEHLRRPDGGFPEDEPRYREAGRGALRRDLVRGRLGRSVGRTSRRFSAGSRAPARIPPPTTSGRPAASREGRGSRPAFTSPSRSAT